MNPCEPSLWHNFPIERGSSPVVSVISISLRFCTGTRTRRMLKRQWRALCLKWCFHQLLIRIWTSISPRGDRWGASMWTSTERVNVGYVSTHYTTSSLFEFVATLHPRNCIAIEVIVRSPRIISNASKISLLLLLQPSPSSKYKYTSRCHILCNMAGLRFNLGQHSFFQVLDP